VDLQNLMLFNGTFTHNLM